MGTLSRHPHCVTVYDSGFTSDDRPYLVMEDMSGRSLRRRMDDGPMPWPQVVAIGVKLAGRHDLRHYRWCWWERWAAGESNPGPSD